MFTSNTFFEDVRELTYFWVAVLATTTLGRHVLNRLKVDKRGSGFLFSLTVLKRKAPIELGAMFFD